MELLFLESIFKERIWGGNRLKSDYGYNIPSNKTGESWSVSAHKNGATYIKNGKFAGTSLADLYKNNPELFGGSNANEFPLMIKIIDANDKLSVQVHPDDKYAKEVENDLGKFECWYILDAKPNSSIIYGHKAKSKEELNLLVKNGKWAELLTETSIKAGDFFPVPTGTVHAIGAGALILEVQQSSDTTYRLYDYDRTDDKGNLRELHITKSLDVINVPHQSAPETYEPISMNEDSTFQILTMNKYFKVGKLDVNGHLPKLNLNVPYSILSIINGNGIINGYEVNKGDNIITPHQVHNLDIRGNLSIIITSEN
ncbi:MAG: class I mannose-6-phosphate isomerase [Burkholderiales bacterium]|nr:class I mannose-6-phosphate isomerase [Burkholderiales bacterium]